MATVSEMSFDPFQDQQLKAKNFRRHTRSPVLPNMPCNMKGRIPPGLNSHDSISEIVQHLLEDIQRDSSQLPRTAFVIIL